MKINQILNYNNNNYHNTNHRKNNFKGYVNGNYYRDEIIMEAKKALNNPNWKEKFLASKTSLGESFSTWHKREGSNDLAGRILMGIFTLGVSEVTWGIAQAVSDANDNSDIDRKIKEIEKCMDDLGNSGGGY